jgi:hypothetical protein
VTLRNDSSKGSEFHDLDDLAGVWSKQEADAFDKALAGQRSMDGDPWKCPGFCWIHRPIRHS